MEANTELIIKELEAGATILQSYPRRLVFDMDVFRSFEPLMDSIEEVTLMGWGEPTIHPHFKEMLEIINRHSARKYFCTNGMNLKKIKDAIFDYNVDVFAVSLDGATEETNARIRRGSKIDVITEDLKDIVKIKKERGLKYPWINFVFCAMQSNIRELPDLVRLAAEIGIEEVKAVYLTAFEESLMNETLWGHEDVVKEVFEEAIRVGEELGIILKLPHLIGEDEAGEKLYKMYNFVYQGDYQMKDYELGRSNEVEAIIYYHDGVGLKETLYLKLLELINHDRFEDILYGEAILKYTLPEPVSLSKYIIDYRNN